MPIMEAAEKPEDFGRMLLYCIASLNVFYFILGDMCYFYLGGDKLKGGFITQDLDQKSIPVILIIIVSCLNMIPTYAIEAAPVYVILEYYLFGCLKTKSDKCKYHA